MEQNENRTALLEEKIDLMDDAEHKTTEQNAETIKQYLDPRIHPTEYLAGKGE